MRALDLCAGAGGLSLGLQAAGFETVGVELDARAAEAHRRGAGPCYVSDVRAFRAADHDLGGPVDLVGGGVPCQSFSMSGRREGTEDPRGGLYKEVIRLGVETGARALLIENVSAIATSKNAAGRAAADLIREAFHEAGYPYFHEATLLAADYGVPQNRRRMFFVGFREEAASKAFSWPAPTHGEGRLPYVTTQEALGLVGTEALAVKLAAAGLLFRPSTTVTTDARVGTAGHHDRQQLGAVALPAWASARLQAFPDDYPFVGPETSAHKQIGNAVPPPLGAAIGQAIYRALASTRQRLPNPLAAGRHLDREQEIDSADTSIRQVPALFRKIAWEPGTVNLDFGGGRYELASEYVGAWCGVENLVYDPSRGAQHNDRVLRRLARKKADSATIANVLNVVQEPQVRRRALKRARSLVKPGGAVYLSVYEGTRSGRGQATTKGWQENRRRDDYLEEIEKVFGKGNVHLFPGGLVTYA